MTTYKLGLPSALKRRLAQSLPEHDGAPVITVTPRDRAERRSAAYDADHYEVSAFYTSTSADALAVLEEALTDVPGVYLTTQLRAVTEGAYHRPRCQGGDGAPVRVQASRRRPAWQALTGRG